MDGNITQTQYQAWFLWLIPLAPLMGAIVNGFIVILFARREKKNALKLAGSLSAVFAAFFSFIVTLFAFFHKLSLPEGSSLDQTLFAWLPVEGFQGANIAFHFDELSAVMLLFITFVAFLIHVYSLGYMARDEGYNRFFAYLNLFLFSMLLLILGDNLLMVFIGWEGVGLCSYLLISFWFADEAKAEAGKKAFITNRIGDAGFLIGMFMTLMTAGSLNFIEMQSGMNLISPLLASITAFAFFVGATGKSAQIPLFVWLPDAMAGPTPVSALIHAATMVTAGVYLVARLHFLFILSPEVMTVVATVGALTAFFAATIALAQFDIKKILAYSTISQLGYMFLGVGVGAFSGGIFHVMTHAFFKALLFLGAGSVIHALHEEQDIRKMGGLLKKIPATAITFIIAWLAISGLPPFSGFFSKDEILWKTFATENKIVPWLPDLLYALGIFTAFLTAFYMTRLTALVFFGKFRGDHHTEEHIHESPSVMTVPLAILAFFSIVAGFTGIPHALGGHPYLEDYLHSVLASSTPEANRVSHGMEITLMGISTLAGVAGIILGLTAYLKMPGVVDSAAKLFSIPLTLLRGKYFVDEIYEALILSPIRFAAKNISFLFIDTLIIEGMINSGVVFSRFASSQMRKIQTGRVGNYLAYMFAGVILLVYMIFFEARNF